MSIIISACGLCTARARAPVLENNTMVRIGQRFETGKFSQTSMSYQAYDTAFQYWYMVFYMYSSEEPECDYLGLIGIPF